MSAKRSFFLTQRIFFLILSLQFLKDAFFFWDGYSYYMRFRDFLPDMSLAFILWSVLGAIVAIVFWGVSYLLPRIIPGVSRIIQFEKMMAWLVFGVSYYFLVFIKKTFIYIPVSNLLHINRSIVVAAVAIILVILIWLLRRFNHIDYEKILNVLDSHITPAVWIFALCFIIAIPSSVIKKVPAEVNAIRKSSLSALHSKEDRPNIILLTMDSLTTQDMQLYGYKRPTTPFISAWARKGFVFNKAYSSANWTTPAAMSLMTGQRPWMHGVWYDAKYHHVNRYANSLPGILKDHGYFTYAFVQNEHAHPEILGLKKAFLKCDWFDVFNNSRKGLLNDIVINFPKGRDIALKWIFQHPIFIPFYFSRSDSYVTMSPAEAVFDRFIDYISRNDKEPFFAWLHILPPHTPYLPPRKYAGIFGDFGKFNTEKKQRNFGFNQQYTPEKQADVDILRKRYDEFILYCDKEFEQFMSRLTERIDVSRTVIIFSSDHGESFSHGYVGHKGPYLYESIVNIPLIVKIPGETGGMISDMPVEQVDIAPTVLELAGVSVPEWMVGRSLVQLFRGTAIESRPVFSMQLQENRAIGGHPITKGSIAIWNNDHKLIYYMGSDEREPELYDLRTDPDETQNIFDNNRKAKLLMRTIKKKISSANERIEDMNS